MAREASTELNALQIKWLDGLREGLNQKEAAKFAGVDECTASRWKKLPQIRKALREGESAQDTLNRVRVKREIERRLNDPVRRTKMTMRDLEVAWKVSGGGRLAPEPKVPQQAQLVVVTQKSTDEQGAPAEVIDATLALEEGAK